MNKKVYLAPNINVVKSEVSAILASSTGATIPDAGWGNVKRRQYKGEIWEEDEDEE